MIISEKQISMLIDVAYKFSIFLRDDYKHDAATGIEEFLEKIAMQQSEELKVIE